MRAPPRGVPGQGLRRARRGCDLMAEGRYAASPGAGPGEDPGADLGADPALAGADPKRAGPARPPGAGAGPVAGIGPLAGPGAPGYGAAEVVAALATLAWLLIAGLHHAALPASGAAAEDGGLVRLALLFVLPVGLIWTAATALRALRVAREETRRLQVAVDALRHSHIAERQARGSGLAAPPRQAGPAPAPQAALRSGPSAAPEADGRSASAAGPPGVQSGGPPGVQSGGPSGVRSAGQGGRTEAGARGPGDGPRARAEGASAPASGPRATGRDADPAFATSRERAQASAQGPQPPRTGERREEQPRLALEPRAEDDSPPLAHADLIRALNFPDSEADAPGFAALRRALRDRRARQLVQASQDVLTLLSQDGIYMDDLHPDRARPEIWRRFAQGERGRAVAALGGIRDRSSLALTAARMREDTIFRDAAHHFLRLFDKTLVAFEPEASDEELVALSDTRTARAFMLFGRVTGTFD